MTDRTKALIVKFFTRLDVNDIPQIIIGLQEEDSVYETLEFPNCFKKLRNMCAHEPANFVQQLERESNKNCLTIAFESESAGKFTLQLYQFTAWMFFMYRKTGSKAYLHFWRAFCVYTCPVLKSVAPEWEITLGRPEKMGLREWVVWFEDMLCAKSKRIRSYNIEDEYYNKIYNEDTKLYMRMIFTNMQDIVCMLIVGQIDFEDVENIDSYLWLYKKREVSDDNNRRAVQEGKYTAGVKQAYATA